MALQGTGRGQVNPGPVVHGESLLIDGGFVIELQSVAGIPSSPLTIAESHMNSSSTQRQACRSKSEFAADLCQFVRTSIAITHVESVPEGEIGLITGTEDRPCPAGNGVQTGSLNPLGVVKCREDIVQALLGPS
jgi:hypothetical protein